MLIINIPNPNGVEQYVMHTISKAWASFTGINAKCFELHNDDMYFGGNGYVGKFWDTNADDGAQISATCQQAYSYFDTPGQLKRFTMVRPILQSTGGVPSVLCGINVDFDTQSREAAESLKLELSNNPHIYAAWLSLSQLGIGALIKVEGITLDNFRESYKEITQELGIEFDPMAVKATQANVISSDPQIYINTNSVPKKVSSINNRETKTILYLEDTFSEFEIPEFVVTESNRVRFNLKVTLPTYNSDCDYYPQGLPYFEAYWPYSHKGQHSKIFSGRRHSTITTFANNLIILNPTVSLEQVVSWIHSFNKSYCVEPFTYKEVYKIVEEKYKLRETLQPLGIKLKKFWVNPNSINKKQSFLICKSITTKAHSLSLIQDFIGLELYNTTSKVTLQTIANYTGLSLITIKRNITQELQLLIKQHNQTLKKVSSINK
jgi:hypothetical protein